MMLRYYPETDSLYIDLTEAPAADSVEVSPGIVLDYDSQGRLSGIDIDNATQHLNLDRLELADMPVPSVTVG